MEWDNARPMQSIALAPASDVAARFDRISEVYDETREPLSKEALDRAADVLKAHDLKLILEAGVGTGRIAGPLQERGLEIVGLDLSRGMLARARAKGVANLLMADANSPPFRAKVFDAALLAHVLHLLDDPALTFTNLSAVAQDELVVFLRRHERKKNEGAGGRDEINRAFQRAASELGIATTHPYSAWRQRFAKQNEFLAKFPPTERITIQEVDGRATLRDHMLRLEKRAFSFASDLSDEDFRRVIGRARLMIDLDKQVKYHRVEEMAIWRIAQSSFKGTP